MAKESKISKRRKEGIVMSDKADKTVVVLVESMKKHPLYQKKYRTSKRFKAHDQKNEYKKGDEVIIEEIRPLSKDKRWRVVGKVKG